MNFFYNVIFVIAWHYLSFRIVILPDSLAFYKEDTKNDFFSFLKKEKFYEKILKIKKWKDKIPQFVIKGGFSKNKIKNLNLEYLKKFIAETYRAEIDHLMCCFSVPFLFFLNNLKNIKLSFIISGLVIIGNLPCVLIQRYNRFRIRRICLKLKNKQNSNLNYSFKN
ncbi:MAG: hypothetical protein IJQ10_02370 [Clostridia bacterium]|nr:hypothetical protein [Clostridia bacterium]